MKGMAIGLLVLLCVPAGFAAKSAAPASSPAEMSPQQAAGDEFRRGAQLLDRAAKQHAELLAAKEKQREAVQKKLNKTLETAVRSFEKATQFDPRMVQAYSELGFALRKLGRYEQSLAAYDKALSIMPGYSPAIEYRAEAHLGLNRVAEARDAYLLLFSGDRPRADLLFAAMTKWVAARSADPAGADPQQVAALAKFVEERAAIHAQTSAATMASKDMRTW
ncbi:MAG TPA: tetratricopeptide repeat protein [Thermoanaerobaculia bacterium]|nr:tetratricopeptide repeat protein [Thermoanaerobaculia bacterium]